jgi:3-oxoacyl-ACP reductase-like protein
MSEHAYDISHLLESEPVMAVPPVSRIAKAPAPAAPPGAAAEQERLARELLQAADAHDALIRQYLGMTDDSYRNTYAL